MTNVVVFCGGNIHPTHELFYRDLAYRLGQQLADLGCRVICGGGLGLMDEVCRGALDRQGFTQGICLDKPGVVQSSHLCEQTLFPDLNSRQQALISAGDAYIGLPGGTGTMYELIEVIERKKVGELSFDKPLIIVGDYYLPLRQQFEDAAAAGFIVQDYRKYAAFVPGVEEALSALAAFKPGN